MVFANTVRIYINHSQIKHWLFTEVLWRVHPFDGLPYLDVFILLMNFCSLIRENQKIYIRVMQWQDFSKIFQRKSNHLLRAARVCGRTMGKEWMPLALAVIQTLEFSTEYSFKNVYYRSSCVWLQTGHPAWQKIKSGVQKSPLSTSVNAPSGNLYLAVTLLPRAEDALSLLFSWSHRKNQLPGLSSAEYV